MLLCVQAHFITEGNIKLYKYNKQQTDKKIKVNMLIQKTGKIGTALLPVVRLRHLSSFRAPNENDLNEEESTILRNIRLERERDKKKMMWRTPVGDRPEDWNSKLKSFANQEQTSDFIIMMQQPLDLSVKGLRNIWNDRQEKLERSMQQFIPERHRILGADLAAAHFVLFRGGAVRFVGEKHWMRANEDGEFPLPKFFNPDFKVEAIRCDDMNLYYEGLENIRWLHHLKFLSFHNVKHFDDWCLDRVSGSDFIKLEVLDISGTKCTDRGLSCLYRLPSLKLLILNNPDETLECKLTCAMLGEILPKLKIVGVDAVHNNETTTN